MFAAFTDEFEKLAQIETPSAPPTIMGMDREMVKRLALTALAGGVGYGVGHGLGYLTGTNMGPEGQRYLLPGLTAAGAIGLSLLVPKYEEYRKAYVEGNEHA